MNTKSNSDYLLALGFLAIGLALLVFQLAKTPSATYDGQFYTWIALSDEHSDIDGRHKAMQEIYKARLHPKQFQSLSQGPDRQYRELLAEDPQAFADQIGFYQVKWLYPTLMRLANNLGMNPLITGELLSAVAFFAAGLIVFLLLSRILPAFPAAIVTLAVFVFSKVHTVATFVTPDALSMAFIIAAYAIATSTRRLSLAGVALLASIAVRPDNMILAVCLATAAAILGPVSRRKSVAFSAVAVGLYLLLQTGTHYVGWSTHFYVSFVDRMIHPPSFRSPLSPGEYFSIFEKVVPYAVASSYIAVVVSIGLLALSLRMQKGRWQSCAYTCAGLLSLCFLTLEIFLPVQPGEKYAVATMDFAATLTLVATLLLILASFTTISSYLFWPKLRDEKTSDGAFDFLLPGLLTAIVCHFVLFPVDKDRMLMGLFVVVMLETLQTVSNQFGRTAWAKYKLA